MWAVFLKEINSFFNSLMAYLVMIIFLVIVGLLVWVFPQTSIFQQGVAQLDTFFSIAPYVFLLLIPAITMRSFAEEKRSGTLELLLTRPLTDLALVLAKFFSCLFLTLFTLLPTLTYYYTLYQLGMPPGNIDTAAVIGSYIGLVLLASVFTAIGVFASSLTENQIVAFLLAVFFCFAFYDGFSSIAAINTWAGYSYFISQLGIDYHYATLSKGLLDLSNIVYFVGLNVLMIFLTRLVLRSRKW